MHARILVCDDETHIRHIIAHKLRAGGFDVLEARNGQEAMNVIEPAGKEPVHPDLVITDYQMPLVTGLELCKFLKLRAQTASTPVLMLTARGYTLSNEELSQTNIRQVISKPFGVRQLMDRVIEVLSTTCPNLIPPALLSGSAGGGDIGPLAA